MNQAAGANFRTEPQPNYVLIHALAGLQHVQCDELLTVFESALKLCTQGMKGIVLDVNHSSDACQQFIRSVLQMQKKIRAGGMELFVANSSRDLTQYISNQGISLPAFEDFKELLLRPAGSATGTPAAKLDVNFINPFVEGALHTLKVQCSIEAKAGKPFLKGTSTQEKTEIAGIIGVSASVFNGSILISFSEKLFLALMSNMLMQQFAEITKDLEDGTAELLNIIFGQAKTVLNNKGYALDKAIPTVVRGNGLAIHHVAASPTMVLPFETEHGVFYIEICISGT